MIPLDPSLACKGYLKGPTGRVRFVRGLDEIARDMERAGAGVFWCALGEQLGCCAWRARRIMLSERVFDTWPYLVRKVLTHELGHICEGPCEQRVQEWQARRYGELVQPAWVEVCGA